MTYKRRPRARVFALATYLSDISYINATLLAYLWHNVCTSFIFSGHVTFIDGLLLVEHLLIILQIKIRRCADDDDDNKT